MSDLKTEIANYQKYVFDNLPIGGLRAYIQCTYVEAYRLPFKLLEINGTKNELISYNRSNWRLFLRDDEHAIVNMVVTDGIAMTREAIGSYPDSFVFVPSKVYKQQFVTYPFQQRENLPCATMTGKYYVDMYGYVWYEVTAHYLPDAKQTAWLRETAINYTGKEELQDEINYYRDIVMKMRSGQSGTSKAKKTTLLGLLTAGLTLLSSK